MLKSMANKKMAMMGGDDVVANVGYSKVGLSEPSEPEYPYCLKLYLGHEEIEKLGLTEMPKLGASIDMVAKVMVVGLSADPKPSIQLQITDMALGKAKVEKSPEQALYGEAETEED